MTENETPETDPLDEETTDTATADPAEGEDEAFSFVEDPEFDIDYKGDCAYEIKVAIPVANEVKKTQELFDELSREAQLPGFRKGRAPRKLLERKFAKHVRREVKEKLVTAAFEKLVEDEGLRPIGGLDIDGLDEEESPEEGAPLTFTLKFEVGPRVELGPYRGVEVERPVLKVADSDVEEALEEMRNRYAMFETIDDGAAQEGDQAIIDFHGTIDGEDFPGGQAENYPYILGSKRFFDEFEQALTGSNPGAELTCDVTFPDDYSNQALSGKTAAFKVKVNEIKRRNVPEPDDEFAQQAGHETVADLREAVANQLRNQAMDQSNQIASRRIIDAVVETSTFEFPKSLVTSLTDERAEEEAQRLRDMRVPQAEIGEREPEIRRQAEARSLKSMAMIVALNEITNAEGLEVTEDDLEKAAASIGERYGVSADRVASLIDEQGNRGTYEMRILHEKATAVLMEHATFTDKEVAFEDLERELTQGGSSDDDGED